MKNNVIKFFLGIVTLFCLCLLCGCESKNVYDVGIIMPNKEQDRWTIESKYLEDEFKKNNIETGILFSNDSIQVEEENINSLINLGIKVLIIASCDANQASSIISKCKENNIKVICYDRLIANSDAVDYYVTFSNEEVGMKQAQYLIDNKPQGKNIPIYLYCGSKNDTNAYKIFKGSWKVLQPYLENGTLVCANSDKVNTYKNHADIQENELNAIVKELSTNWESSVAHNIASKDLEGNDKSLKGDVLVLAPNDTTARSISEAFSLDKDITSFKITGQDGELASIAYLEYNKQSMTIFKNTLETCNSAIELTKDILAEKEITTSDFENNGVKDVATIYSDIVLLTRDNYKEELLKANYYTEDEITFE